MRTHPGHLLLCALIPLVLLAGCSATGDGAVLSAESTTTPAPFADVAPDPVRIGVRMGAESLPLWIAEKDGILADAGLEVALVTFASDAERDAAFLKGEIDAFVGDVASAATLESKGAPVALVAVLTDPVRAAEPSGTIPPAGEDDITQAYLGFSDSYLALPSGLVAARAVLAAWNEAVVLVQADPASYAGTLAEIAGPDAPDPSAVSNGYLAALPPAEALIEPLLVQWAADASKASALAPADLVLDIGR